MSYLQKTTIFII